MRQLALAAGENVVIDGTLSWDQLPAQYIDELFMSRYQEVDVVNVETSQANAIERARQRWWRGRTTDSAMGGRFVPDVVIEHCFVGGDKSVCAENALLLAQMAAESLGRGTLRRFEVNESTGDLQATHVTTFQ